GGCGDDRGAAVGAYEEHPSAITVARTAAPSVATAPSLPMVDLNTETAACALARIGSIKPYRIAVLAVKNPVIPCPALARRERTILIPHRRADNDKPSIHGYLNSRSNGRRPLSGLN
ncbi:MAG: hypothetical protein WB580_09230, partial [Candidatus Binataceae bacterium]